MQEVFMIPEEFYLPNNPVAQLVNSLSPFYPRFNQQQFDRYIQEFEVPAAQKMESMSYGQKKKCSSVLAWPAILLYC
ncbi:hypothetical protein [Paraflavitalea speifideaquila]|uniref:hypothetical protein n=1 Tax=Paraflavitalea speifideaquila TaxID=3076558 RepID=UPI0028EA1C46|nr:hypothetical protein [Paraflavitalea speifideiaquila]